MLLLRAYGGKALRCLAFRGNFVALRGAAWGFVAMRADALGFVALQTLRGALLRFVGFVALQKLRGPGLRHLKVGFVALTPQDSAASGALATVFGHCAAAANARKSAACAETFCARLRVICKRSASLPGTPRSRMRLSIRSNNHFFFVSGFPRQMCLCISV